MRDPVRRAAVLSALSIGIGVMVLGILPDLLIEGWLMLAVLHAAVGLGTAMLGYFLISRTLTTLDGMRASTAALRTDLDVHERLLAENMQQRHLLEAILESDPVGIAVIAGPDLQYRLVNPAHRGFTPHPEIDPADRPYVEVWGDAGCNALAPILHHVAQTGETIDLRCEECRHPDGRVYFFGVHLRRLSWEQGQAVLMVLRDNTAAELAEAQMRDALEAAQRREAEVAALLAQLETSEERWRLLVDNANDAMVTMDCSGQILFWNRAAQAIFGYEEQEILGQHFTSLLVLRGQPSQDEQAWEEYLAAASALQGKSLEATGRRRSGEEFPLEYSFAVWRTHESSFITASICDITERLQAQRLAAVEERQRLARELHDSVSQALYGVALGANTALTMLDSSREHTVAALEYVISLADLALTEMRALIFQLRPDALQREGLIAGLAKQNAAIRARNSVSVQEEYCPEPGVPLDVKESVYRIAQEALNNAVKHAQATVIWLRVDQSGDCLELEISDNGIGFDPGQPYPGHLGLRSMHERADQQGGSLEIDSRPGCGTRVRAIIPGHPD